ncbi:MAG: hypothetical protein AVDCRST_MAG68-2404, partial [uncultured Gemmatimonadetes bacterium]
APLRAADRARLHGLHRPCAVERAAPALRSPPRARRRAGPGHRAARRGTRPGLRARRGEPLEGGGRHRRHPGRDRGLHARLWHGQHHQRGKDVGRREQRRGDPARGDGRGVAGGRDRLAHPQV